MPTVRKPEPVAVLCSDLHLTLIPPACRNDERSWMDVQSYYLKQLKTLAKNSGHVPIVCAGDIFDKWNPAPELITYALRELPDDMICVPGQHDLPNHRIDEMDRSGYGVLSEARKIRDISKTGEEGSAGIPGVYFFGFGWGQEILPPDKDLVAEGKLCVAVIHRYCWTKGKNYPGAPETAHVNKLGKQLKGYDVAIFGDNHKGFISTAGDCCVVNCGGFIRRKSDERFYEPAIYTLLSDGKVIRHPLDTEPDRFHPPEKVREAIAFDMQEFIRNLNTISEHGMDFRQIVKEHMEKEDVHPKIRQIITQALEESKPIT